MVRAKQGCQPNDQRAVIAWHQEAAALEPGAPPTCLVPFDTLQLKGSYNPPRKFPGAVTSSGFLVF